MNIAVLDLETNGTPGSSVLSASSIIFNSHGFILDFINRFYFPQERPNLQAIRIHGLTPERLAALREQTSTTPAYFIEDWSSLLDFWDKWTVSGIVVHNLRFDTSFLPELLQGKFRWWCSMQGLTLLCALPKRPGNLSYGTTSFKWPKLAEATEIICNRLTFSPSEITVKLEKLMLEQAPHVSLYDCFQLYRVVSRLTQGRPELLQFKPHITSFRASNGQYRQTYFPQHDAFTQSIITYEQKLRSAI